MTEYRYKARDREGKVVEGSLEGGAEAAVARRLLEMGYFPVRIRPTRGPLAWGAGRGGRVPVTEVVMFFRQLSTMYAAGLPFIYSLSTLAESTRNRAFRDLIQALRSDVEGGGSFTEAVARHPEVFDEVTVNMIKVGETSGTLAEILERLADYGERAAELRSRVKNAMAYPVVLSVVALGVLVFALTVVMPKFTSIFAKLNAPLPWPTRLLMALSGGITRGWWVILLLAGAGTVLFLVWRRTGKGRWAWDGILFRVPVLGPLRLKTLTSRLARNLGTLVESGVDILFSFQVCERTVGSVRLASALRNTRERVKEGESIAPVLEGEGAFPPLLTRMIGVGEQTGRLGEMLSRVAHYYEVELDLAIKRLTTLMEPLMVILMAGVVAFVAAATLLPLFSMVKYIK